MTYELVNKKRSKSKRNAIIGFISGFAVIALAGLLNDFLPEPVMLALMILVAVDFIISLFIINYSYKYKVVVGHISFKQDLIEIEIFQRKEEISNSEIRKIRFKLAGYEGLNNSSVMGILLFPWERFSYCSGLNNFVYIQTARETRTFEFFIANKKEWINIHRIIKYYHSKTISGKQFIN